MLLHFAATQSTPWECPCILQQLNQPLGYAPAFCSNSINPLDMLLHFAAAQSTPWICSCILQQLNQPLGYAPAFLQRPINPLVELLHFCNGQSTPWLSSCIFATTGEELRPSPAVNTKIKRKDALLAPQADVFKHHFVNPAFLKSLAHMFFLSGASDDNKRHPTLPTPAEAATGSLPARGGWTSVRGRDISPCARC